MTQTAPNGSIIYKLIPLCVTVLWCLVGLMLIAIGYIPVQGVNRLSDTLIGFALGSLSVFWFQMLWEFLSKYRVVKVVEQPSKDSP